MGKKEKENEEDDMGRGMEEGGREGRKNKANF